MIDIRDISYTQGSPLNPVLNGEIVETAPILPTRETPEIESGEIVSINRVEKTPDLGVPQYLIDLAAESPLQWGVSQVTNFWDMLTGTPEQKTQALLDYIPAGETSKDIYNDAMEQLKNTMGEDFTEQNYLVTGGQPIAIDMPNIEFPDIFGGLKNVGWYILGGIGLIGGIYILGRYLGRSKK